MAMGIPRDDDGGRDVVDGKVEKKEEGPGHVPVHADTDERMREYLIYGAKAGGLASAATAAALYGIQRTSTILSGFSPSAKLATVLTIGLGTTVIAAENAVYQVRHPNRKVFRTDRDEGMKEAGWAETLFHYRHPIVGGTFAAAVATGAVLASRDPFRSGTQKFLNIRLYGQGLALAALFGTIGLGSVIAQHKQLEREEREREEAGRLYGKWKGENDPTSISRR